MTFTNIHSLVGCPIISTFTNGQIDYTPATNLITGVYRWTTVATFNCSTGYYLSTLSSSTTTTDCSTAGSWTSIPQCLRMHRVFRQKVFFSQPHNCL